MTNKDHSRRHASFPFSLIIDPNRPHSNSNRDFYFIFEINCLIIFSTNRVHHRKVAVVGGQNDSSFTLASIEVGVSSYLSRSIANNWCGPNFVGWQRLCTWNNILKRFLVNEAQYCGPQLLSHSTALKVISHNFSGWNNSNVDIRVPQLQVID